MKSRLALIVVLVLVVASASLYRTEPSGGQSGASEAIGLTVTEPAGVARSNETVTSGVPVPSHLVGARWALFDGQNEIPLQTTELPGVRTTWLLLDFQTSLAANGTKLFTLRSQTPTMTPGQTLTVSESAFQATIVTGPLQVQIGKADFNLLDGVWLDQDGDGQFRPNERILAASPGDNLFIRDAGTNLIYSGRGIPAAFTWEDLGPLRGTLRVDGSYRNGLTTLLDYTARMTFTAGSPVVRVDFVIRNSLRYQERYVKLRSAKLNFGSSATTDRLAHSGVMLWRNAPTGGVSLELLPALLTYSTRYDPEAVPPIQRSNATLDVDANDGMVIADLSYHGGSVVLDFTPGLNTAQQEERATGARYRLLALASPQWYSDLGAFGSDHFGTYDDEKACYQQWGWTWPTPGQCWSNEHHLPLYPDFAPGWETLDSTNDPESDDLWANLLMGARTGHYPYFLRAQGWATYMKWEFANRTDGFPYAGSDFLDGPFPVVRAPAILPLVPTAADLAYITNNIKRGKVKASHTWNGGLIDYYYLTGDRDALQAGLDLAEQSARYEAWRTPGTVSGIAGGRFDARSYLNSLRAWEATSDPQWRSSADHIRDLFLQSLAYDPRGFYYKATCELGADYCARFPNGLNVSPFQFAIAVQALYRDYLLSGSAALRARLLAMSAFAHRYASDSDSGYTGDEMVLDSPTPESVRHLSYSEFRNTTPVVPSLAASSGIFIDALTIGYRLTGNTAYLRHARQLWDRASKGDPGSQFATPTQVGRFVNSLECWDKASVLFPNSGDLTSVQHFFHDAARTDLRAPADVTNLSGH